MSWSGGFITALKKTGASPKYKLIFHNNPNGPGSATIITGGYQANQSIGYRNYGIGHEGPRVSGCSITPGRWSVNFGGFEVPIVGNIKKLFPKIVRGSFASLYVDIDGIEERIAFGQLKQISGTHGKWNFIFQDIISSLAAQANGKITSAIYSSLPNNHVAYGKFFSRSGMTTSAPSTHPYTLGGNTIRVLRSQNFEKQYGKNGLAKIEMKDSGGAVLGTAHFEWTSKSAVTGVGDLTLSADSKAGNVIYPGDTPLQSFHSGTVTNLSMAHGTPWDILSYLILSIDGGNTNYVDQFPESWCAGGGFPSDIIDWNNIQIAASYILPSNAAGTYSWSLPIETPWDAGLRTFTDLCTTLGQWPVWRQNAITYRGARNLFGQHIYPTKIEDHQIISVTNQELYSPDVPEIYGGINIQYSSTSTDVFQVGMSSDEVPSKPFLPLYSINAQTYYDPQYSRLYNAAGDVSRMKQWLMNPIETATLELPLHFAKLCAGDIVQITSKYLFSQKGNNDTWRNQRAMVLGVSYDFQRGSCIVRVGTYRLLWS